MKKIRHRLEKLFVRLAGEDYEAYEACSPETQKDLIRIGVLVVVIFVLTFLGITEAFTELFHSAWVGVGIGLFFAWLVSNMYLLLLYTLTRNVLLPVEKSIPSKISFNIRLATVAFLGLIVSKPIEHFLFRSTVTDQLVIIKENKFKEIEAGIWDNYKHMTGVVNDQRSQALANKRDADIKEIKALISDNSYYVHGLKLLGQKSWIWTFTGCTVFLFCLPVFWKRRIPVDSTYYVNKRRQQTGLVTKAFAEFKDQYKAVFENFTKEELVFSEPFSDPPFNLEKKKDDVQSLSEESFITTIYGG